MYRHVVAVAVCIMIAVMIAKCKKLKMSQRKSGSLIQQDGKTAGISGG